MTSNYIAGEKRRSSERPRTYAISSDNKRNKAEFEEENKENIEIKENNFISHINNYDDLWEIKKDTKSESKVEIKDEIKHEKEYTSMEIIQFRLQSLSDSVRTTKDHLDLINFFSKSNYDLLHSELTYALDNLDRIKKENEDIKSDLINFYKSILKKE